MKLYERLMTVRFLRSQMKGGTVWVMFLFWSSSWVTVPLVQVISGQLQWVEFVFNDVKWLRDGGFSQCRFSFSRNAFYLSLCREFAWVSRRTRRKKKMVLKENWIIVGVIFVIWRLSALFWYLYSDLKDKQIGGQSILFQVLRANQTPQLIFID